MFGRVRNLFKALKKPRHAAAAGVLLLLLGCGGYFGGRYWWANRHYQAAVAALAKYDFPAAKKHLAVCLEVWPEGPGTRLLAAQVARREGALEEASALLRRCRDLGCPEEAIALEHLLLRGQRRDPAALAELQRRVAANDPETAQMLEVLIQWYVDTFQLGRALLALNRFLELRPDNINALVGRGWVFEHVFDHAAAAADYRAAVRLDPKNDTVRLKLAERLVITGPPSEALREFEHLEQRRGPVPVVLLGLARCRRQLGEAAEACKLLDRLLAREPEHADALAERGKAALDLNQLDEAERWLKHAAQRNPYSREVHYNLAQCLLRASRAREAESYLARYRKIDADLKRLDRLTSQILQKPTDADLRCEVGEIFLRNGEARDGVHWLKSALLQDPRHRKTHAALARHYRATGQVALAEQHERLAGKAASASNNSRSGAGEKKALPDARPH